MTGIKQRWVIGVSVLFVLAAELIAVSDDNPVAEQAEGIAKPSAMAVRTVSEIAPTTVSSASAKSVQAISYRHRREPSQLQQSTRPCKPRRFDAIKARCRAKYWGYPEEFCAPPLGSMLESHLMTQIANGRTARMALYQYDFIPDSSQLTTRGRAQLAQIAGWMAEDQCPVFVESTPNNVELDELRRQTIWREISSNYFEIPSEQVIVGRPHVRDLGAFDALLLDRNRLGLTASRGVSSSGGTSGTSSTTSGATGTTSR